MNLGNSYRKDHLMVLNADAGDNIWIAVSMGVKKF